jgi:hypothetical protein
MEKLESTAIEKVDLRNMSIDEMRRVNNPVLREALLEVKEQMQQELSQSYVSHSQHSSHSNS